MTMGIYDSRNRTGVARSVTLEEANGTQYQHFDLGTHQLDSHMYVWVAPPQRQDVQAVFVDRIYLIRQPPE